MKAKDTKKVRKGSFYARHKGAIHTWLFIFVTFALLFKGVMQQPAIDENKAKIEELKQQIEYEELRKAEVEAMKDEVNSDEYIEKIARDKLGMIKENEKIFIDVSGRED